ncbi:MAG: hypothetical protein EBS54_02480 [Betaproteobacteria bacterium]|nr:hypothetical protein [Betaproteobacteria bacterium]
MSTAEALEQKAAALGEALTQYAQGGPQGASAASGSGSAKGNTGQATVAPSATPTANANANAGNSTPGAAPLVPSNIAELADFLKAYKSLSEPFGMPFAANTAFALRAEKPSVIKNSGSLAGFQDSASISGS